MHPWLDSPLHFLRLLTMFKPRAESCIRRGWEISCICPTFHWSWTILNFFIFCPCFHGCSRRCCLHFICSWGRCPFCKPFHDVLLRYWCIFFFICNNLSMTNQLFVEGNFHWACFCTCSTKGRGIWQFFMILITIQKRGKYCTNWTRVNRSICMSAH